jgi:uncharacterized protein (TIGR03000 family)
MIRQVFSYGGILLLAGAVTLATPGSGWAQRGGHGGGGHFGGGHGGGHFGGGHGGGGHWGGYHGGGFYRGGGFRYGYPYGHYGYGHYGYRHYYPYYGYGYNSPYWYGYDYGTYPYLSAYDSGYAGAYGDVTPTAPDGFTGGYQYQSFYPPTTPTVTPPDTRAYVTVHVPAGARVWFEGAPTTSTGPVRQFYSPPLASGSQYTYDIKATWTENGHEVTQTKKVAVTPGAHVNVDFPVPKTAAQASATKNR